MTAECSVCLNTGPVLMPVRYAIVPDRISQTLPGWAAPATPFPALSGYHYALRSMRQGFIYVYYDTGAKDLLDWEVWCVDENGDLYKKPAVLGAKPVFNPLPCGRPVHQATNLEHMALSENALKYETWVAFSHAPWTKQTLELYTRDTAARSQRMQNIQPPEWNVSGGTFDNGLNRVSEEVLNSVLDYRPNLTGSPTYPLRDSDNPFYQVSYIEDDGYHFFDESIRPHTTFHPWVRSRRLEGAASRSVKAMQSRSLGPGGKPVYPLIMALKDPVGITHELTSWSDGLALAHQCYLDELTVEFATWRNINGIRNQVQQALSAQQAQHASAHDEQDLQLLYRSMGSAGYSREQISQFHEEGTLWANQQGVAYEWHKYDKKLNHAKLDQFTRTYEKLCLALDTQLTQLVELRLAWLQDKHFLQCLDDHYTNVPEDNLNYREIVGYAISAINVVPAGRQKIQAWVKEYSATNNSNLFWRRQFFNNPDVISETTPVLTQLSQDANTEDRPATDVEKPAILVAFKSFVGYLGKYNDACDRALEALERDEKKAVVSGTRKLMAKMDTGLTTFTTEVFNKSLLGNRLDSFSNLIYKTLFARDAGIAMYDIEEDIERQMATGPNGAWARRRAMWDKRIKIRDETITKYQTELSTKQLAERTKPILAPRIKLLGTILSVWELYSQSKEIIKEGEGSASDIMSVGLFAASFGIQTAIPALKIIEKASEEVNPLVRDRVGKKLTAWAIRANAYGSIAAGLMVISDFGALGESFTKDGSVHWTGVGLSAVKIVSDGAYTIQSSEELLKLLGKKTIQQLIVDIAGTSSGPILRGISFFASWQVMTLIILTQVAIAVFSDDELQNWCEKCVFGTNPSIGNTETIPASKRLDLTLEQEDQLVKALHETLGLPLTERVKQQEETEKLNQLKAENRVFQHVHN
ncbi:T6SS effector BTH_I2691 family protein [Scandinavium sp. M-37]|uniref:T6SS effector BTH_I2691 family protein n=1 Tax=Scandinavium sp. M-37 TaxID=3373077 RepID=UPI003744F973